MLFSITFPLLLSVSSAQHVQVDPEVQAFPGESVLLPCKFLETNSRAAQVRWIYEASGGDRINIAVFSPTFGPSFPDSPLKGRVRFTQASVDEGSIEISNVMMSDEGTYTCEYATFPSGPEEGTTKLVVHAPPTSQPTAVTGTTSALSTSAVSSGPVQCMQIEAEIQAFPTGSVQLRCKVLEPANIKVNQVSWIYESSGGDRVNIAVFHPQFGPSFPDSPLKGRVRFTQASVDESAIELIAMTMSDEGHYICQYSTYPSGSLESTTKLLMRAPPTPCLQ